MTSDSQKLRQRVSGLLQAQSRPTTTILSSLLAAQDGLGYLPNEAIEEVASFTGVSINDVWGVASFYTNFRFKPHGHHIVEVCWGPTCHLVGASRVLKRLLADLDLDNEGESPDDRVTLKYNTCLGACSRAPVMSVDHRLHGNVSPDDASKLVAALPEF